MEALAEIFSRGYGELGPARFVERMGKHLLRPRKRMAGGAGWTVFAFVLKKGT